MGVKTCYLTRRVVVGAIGQWGFSLRIYIYLRYRSAAPRRAATSSSDVMLKYDLGFCNACCAPKSEGESARYRDCSERFATVGCYWSALRAHVENKGRHEESNSPFDPLLAPKTS